MSQITVKETASGMGAVTNIAGNTGVATPAAGVITITTGAANTQGTAVFTASGSTVTQTFNDVNNNLGLGSNSLNSMSAGFAVQNTGIGTNTLTAVTTGDDNVAIGYNALQALTVGNWSTAVGSEALQAYNNSMANDAFGWRSLRFATTGQQNCAFGSSALSDITTGNGNVAIGNQSGGALQTNSSSNICINHTGVLLDQNTLRIGQATGSGSRELNRAFIYGIDGVNVGSVAKVATINSDQLGSATITAGTGVSVVPTANTITINATGGGVAWSVISADQTAAVNRGYFCNKAGLLLLALPTTAAVGDVIEVVNINTAAGARMTQAAGQQIFIGNTNTTLGAGGTLSSTALGDSIKLVCRTANTIFQVVSMMGNWDPI